MKSKFAAGVAAVVFFLCSVVGSQATTGKVITGEVSELVRYDTSMLSATRKRDINEKWTLISVSLNQVGIYNDAGEFIKERNVWKYSDGKTKLTEDLINGAFEKYNTFGIKTAKYDSIDMNQGDGWETKTTNWTLEYYANGILKTEKKPGTGKNDPKFVEIINYRPDSRVESMESISYESGTQGKEAKTTSKYAYDVAGNIKAIDVFDNDGKAVGHSYFANSKQTEQWSYTEDNVKFRAALFNYRGLELDNVVYYNADGKVEQTVYRDKYGRNDYVKNPAGEIITKYKYNDTTKDVFLTVRDAKTGKDLQICVKPGGILESVTTRYSDGGSGRYTSGKDTTYYHNGSSLHSAITISYDVAPTAPVISNPAPTAPVWNWAGWNWGSSGGEETHPNGPDY